jgi:hypothetical protein
MSDYRYRVKWTPPPNGATRYGIFQDPKFVPEEWRKIPGMSYVQDAVTGICELVNDALIVDIPFNSESFRRVNHMTGEVYAPGDEYEQYMAKLEAEAEARVAALPPGLCVGKFFHMGVGDGSATYEIVKINKATVKVQWRGYWNADQYVDRALGYECNVRRNWAEAQIRSEEGMRKLFSKPAPATAPA